MKGKRHSNHVPLKTLKYFFFSNLHWILSMKVKIKGEGKGCFPNRKWTSTFLSFCFLSLVVFLVFFVFGVEKIRMKLDYLLYKQSPGPERSTLSSLHFRVRRRLPTLCQAAWPLTLRQLVLGGCCRGGQLPASDIRVPWDPSWCRWILGWTFPRRSGGGDVLHGAACRRRASFPRALFSAAGAVGRQRLQQLGGRPEADVVARLCCLGEHGQSSAAPAAGLAAQLVVARNGAVPREHLHLAEDGFVSMTRLIWKSKSTQRDGQSVSPGAENLPRCGFAERWRTTGLVGDALESAKALFWSRDFKC